MQMVMKNEKINIHQLVNEEFENINVFKINKFINHTFKLIT